MKYRYSFVSNSSSTSFILAYDERKFIECPHCKQKPFTLTQLLDNRRCCCNNNDDDTQIEEENRSCVLEHLSRGIKEDWGDKAQLQTLYDTIINLPLELTVIEVRVSYHDQLTNDLLKNLIEQKLVQVLSSSE